MPDVDTADLTTGQTERYLDEFPKLNMWTNVGKTIGASAEYHVMEQCIVADCNHSNFPFQDVFDIKIQEPVFLDLDGKSFGPLHCSLPYCRFTSNEQRFCLSQRRKEENVQRDCTCEETLDWPSDRSKVHII